MARLVCESFIFEEELAWKGAKHEPQHCKNSN